MLLALMMSIAHTGPPQGMDTLPSLMVASGGHVFQPHALHIATLGLGHVGDCRNAAMLGNRTCASAPVESHRCQYIIALEGEMSGRIGASGLMTEGREGRAAGTFGRAVNFGADGRGLGCGADLGGRRCGIGAAGLSWSTVSTDTGGSSCTGVPGVTGEGWESVDADFRCWRWSMAPARGRR